MGECRFDLELLLHLQRYHHQKCRILFIIWAHFDAMGQICENHFVWKLYESLKIALNETGTYDIPKEIKFSFFSISFSNISSRKSTFHKSIFAYLCNHFYLMTKNNDWSMGHRLRALYHSLLQKMKIFTINARTKYFPLSIFFKY